MPLARLFIKLLPIVVATAVAACALGAPSDALAGNNGQQIKLCPNLTVSNGFAYVLGSQPERRHDRQPRLRARRGVERHPLPDRLPDDQRLLVGGDRERLLVLLGRPPVYPGLVRRPTVEPVHRLQDVRAGRRLSPHWPAPRPAGQGQAAMASTTEETSPRGPWALPRKRPHTPSASAIGAKATTASTAAGRSRRSPAHPGTHAWRGVGARSTSPSSFRQAVRRLGHRWPPTCGDALWAVGGRGRSREVDGGAESRGTVARKPRLQNAISSCAHHSPRSFITVLAPPGPGGRPGAVCGSSTHCPGVALGAPRHGFQERTGFDGRGSGSGSPSPTRSWRSTTAGSGTNRTPGAARPSC